MDTDPRKEATVGEKAKHRAEQICARVRQLRAEQRRKGARIEPVKGEPEARARWGKAEQEPG